MLFFTAYSLITIFFGSVSFSSLPNSASLGTGYLTSFPHSQRYHCFDFIYPRSWLAGRAQFMHSTRIGLCPRGKFSFLLHLLLIGKPCDGVLQVVYFRGNIILEPIHSAVKSALHSINFLS